MILDVGANEGDYARLVLVNSTSAVVYCFKPLPEVFDKLAGGGGCEMSLGCTCISAP